MNAGAYSAVSGGILALARLDAITNNLANASTPGFKAERVAQRAAAIGAAPDATAVATPIARVVVETDFSQGPIEPTGDPFDVALDGKGFLVVDGPRGERLTRRGNFEIDAEGFLATKDGWRVQGENGDLHVGGLGNGPLVIASDGAVHAGDVTAGKLRIVTVADPSKLVREGGTVFAAGSLPLAAAAPGDVGVRQGALEGANASPIESLVALIDTMRGYEAYMRAAERLDQVSGRAVSDVGRV